MGVCVRLRDGEPETASLSARASLEPVEEPRHELFGNAVAGVRDDDPDELVALARLDRDRRLPVAGGVGDEVRDDAVEHERIRDHGDAGIDLEADRARRRRLDDLLEHLAQHERLGVDRHRVRVQPREVEQLVDQPPHAVGLLPGRSLELAANVVVERSLALAQRRQDPVDGGRRCPQLVRGDGDEAQLQLVEGDHLVVDAGLLDRDGEPLGDELEQLGVVPRERARRQGADVQDADDVLADRERHAEQGLDPLLAQERVVHVGVIDVREADRPALCCDSAGEAPAERDPNALLDLFLDADGSTGEEVPPLGVDQEHRARVDAENRADPVEKLVQKRIELEMGEAGVHDRLHVLDPPARRPLRLEGPGM